jgi:hypothetical protein
MVEERRQRRKVSNDAVFGGFVGENYSCMVSVEDACGGSVKRCKTSRRVSRMASNSSRESVL